MTAAAFEATFTDWRLIKGRKCVQVVFEVPVELADRAYQVLGGMPDPGASVWCGIARLNMVVAAPVADKAAKPRTKVAPEKRLAQQAGICCADPVFQQFLFEKGVISVANKMRAADGVRFICKIASRSDITPGSQAAQRWDNLYSRFIAWRDAPGFAA